MERKDGPPRRHVDVSKIPNAVPRHEPLSRQGNMPSYVVFGKRYHVMPSSKNYQEIGGASWYGRKFHGQLTSNGETYDMFAMTAAHKTLPLPTYVKVTNLNNQRTVIVRVNDRGPFHSDRIIDLSYTAAKKLGIYEDGTAHVQVEAIHTAPNQYAKKDTKAKSARRQNTTYLQLGAFSERQNAERLRTQIEALGSFPIAVKHHRKPHKLYKVQIGPLSPQEALDAHHILLAHGLTDSVSVIQ